MGKKTKCYRSERRAMFLIYGFIVIIVAIIWLAEYGRSEEEGD